MVAASAAWIAAVRARETRRPDRLFADPFAHELAGEAGYAMMARSEQAAGRESRFIPVRVRWFDDLTQAAVDAGVRQVVLLGAGLDTRPWRLDLPAQLAWFDVDRAEVFSDKQRVLAGHAARCQWYPVVADLAGEWEQPLRAAGFRAGTATAWLAEGLFFYLPPEAVVALLRRAAHLSGAGSLFAADVMGEAGGNRPALTPYREWCARHGVPQPFGTNDPVELFADGGWPDAHAIAPGAPGASYGRIPAQAAHRTGRAHLVTARRGRHG